jgi:hypothetical protein
MTLLLATHPKLLVTVALGLVNNAVGAIKFEKTRTNWFRVGSRKWPEGSMPHDSMLHLKQMFYKNLQTSVFGKTNDF